MVPLDKMKQQHQELLRAATDLGRKLDQATVERDAALVRKMLSQLVGKLTMHLALEDDYLYPTLLERGSDTVQGVASRFVEEMGGLRQAVDVYNRRWLQARAIADAPAEFVTQTQGLLGQLAERIQREEGELYPLVEAED